MEINFDRSNFAFGCFGYPYYGNDINVLLREKYLMLDAGLLSEYGINQKFSFMNSVIHDAYITRRKCFYENLTTKMRIILNNKFFTQ